MTKRSFLPAIDVRQLGRQNLIRCVVFGMSLSATLVTGEAAVKNRIDPTAQVFSVAPVLVPARQRPFETLLDEIIGTLLIAMQEHARVAAQPGDVRLQKCG